MRAPWTEAEAEAPAPVRPRLGWTPVWRRVVQFLCWGWLSGDMSLFFVLSLIAYVEEGHRGGHRGDVQPRGEGTLGLGRDFGPLRKQSAMTPTPSRTSHGGNTRLVPRGCL